MATSFEKQSSNLGVIDVTIERENLTPAYNKAIKQVAKNIQIKGFRPGHVPIELVKKRHGLSILVEETYKIIDTEIKAILEAQKLNFVGQPMQLVTPSEEELNGTGPVKATFEVSFVDEFSIDLSKLSYESPEIIPSEEAVDDSIEKIKQQYASDIKPEEVAKGDFVFGDLSDAASEFNKYIGIPTEKVKEGQLFKFVGLEKDSTVTINVKDLFESDRDLEMLLGKDSIEGLLDEYSFKVAEISRMQPAELNKELFDKVLGEDKNINSEAEFRNGVKDLISQNYSRETQNVTRINLEEALISQANLDINEDFMKRYIKLQNEKLTDEEIDKEFHLFIRGMKVDLIFNQIANQFPDEITVNLEDMVEAAKERIMGYFGGSGMAMQGMEGFIDNMTREMFKKDAKDLRKNLDEYSKIAFETKTSALINTKASPVTTFVTIDEFKDIVSAINKKLNPAEFDNQNS